MLTSTNEKELLAELEALLTGFWLTDLANFAAFISTQLKEINWVGFYLSDGRSLRLGPFIGNTACVEIAFDRGVCGASFSKDEALIVKDVQEFPGHIACDPNSRSEMVLPFKVRGQTVGVLDLDAPITDRFQKADLKFVESALDILSAKIGTQGQLAELEILKI
jgi:L-methionine (R)-S-oxide reductase